MAVTDACLQAYVLVTLPRYNAIIKLMQDINVDCRGRDEYMRVSVER